MPLVLPRVVVSGRGIEMWPEGTVSDVEGQRLVAIEARSSAVRWTIERCVPLQRRRWAVGRRVDGRGIWRIVDDSQVDRVGGQPAWLWTADSWFDLDVAADVAGRAPAALPLRAQIRFASPLGERSRRTIKALAAMVAAVRAGEQSVALVVPPELLASASHPARWFALALMTVLPPTRRNRIAIMVGEPSPIPDDARVVLTDRPLPGFLAIDVTAPPDEGDDLVAYYLRNRLYDDDPEALEAAAYLYDGGDARDDRWGDGIAALIRDGVPGVSEVTADLVASDAERAVRALAARLRAGATLDDVVIAQLVAVTRATGDPRPWRTLWTRSAVQRADAVDALLVHAKTVRPPAELIEILGAVYPRDAPLDGWVSALLQWLNDDIAPDTVVQTLETTLLEWPLAATGATMASVWSEVVLALVTLGHDEDAMGALVGRIASKIAHRGHGRALVASWSTVPYSFRDPTRMRSLIGLLHGAPEGDQAVVELFRFVRGHADEASTLVEAWVIHSLDAPAVDDPVLEAVRHTDFAADWARATIANADAANALQALQRWAPDAADPLWTHVADVAMNQAGVGARARLLALNLLVHLRPTLEPRARTLLGEALDEATLPDEPLAAAAESFATVEGASPAWAWVAVTAATPGAFDDATIDATVVDFANAEVGPATVGLAAASVRGLGSAQGWEPLELARWIVRLALAPLHPARATALALALTNGIAERPDGLAVLADICLALFDLPDDHPVLVLFLDELLPSAWPQGLPDALVAGVDDARVPEVHRALWRIIQAP